MNAYMAQKKIDHLKYLDEEEQWLESKVSKYTLITTHFDKLTTQKNKLEQELDAIRAKIEVTKEGKVMDEFVIISGVCNNQSISRLERVIFRQTKGHSIVMANARDNNPSTSVFLAMMNKNIYKHIG